MQPAAPGFAQAVRFCYSEFQHGQAGANGMIVNGGAGHEMPGNNGRGWRITLITVLLAACFLRVIYLAEIAGQPEFRHPIYDPQYNHYWAKGLAAGDWTLPEGVNDPRIRTTPHGRPPGYPWFLAGVYAVFGTHPLPPRLVQMGLGLISVLLMFLLARRCASKTTAIIAMLFMGLYWAFPYFEGLLTYPSVVIFLLLCMMLALESWTRHQTLPRIFAAGLLLGLFGLFRPNGLLFAPVLVLWIAWVLCRRQRARRIPAQAAVCAAGILIAIAPPLARNYLAAEDFVFLSSYGGLNFYVGNNPEADAVEPRIPELRELAGIDNWCCFDYPVIVDGLARKLGREELSFSEANAWFYARAADYIRRHPRDFLRGLGRKTLLFWGPQEITNDTVLEIDKARSAVLHFLPGFPLVMALFLPGLYAALRRKKDAAVPAGADRGFEIRVLMALFILTYFISVLPFFIAARYRLPVIPFLLFFGACGLAAWIGLLRRGQWKKAAAGILAVLLLFFAARINFAGYEASPAIWHFRKAMAYEADRQAASAVEHYRRTIQQAPDLPEPHFNLARLLETQGAAEEAIGHYRKAVKLRPDNTRFRFRLARLLARQDEAEQAIQQYRELLERDPEDADAANNLGLLYAETDRPEDASTVWRAAIARNPDHTLLRLNLGNLYYKRGALEAACDEYRAVTEADPENPWGWYNLGNVYDRRKEPGAAEEAYRKALVLRPDQPEIHNNLGWLLLRRNEPEKAMNHFRAALKADPDFLTARINLGHALRVAGCPEEAAEVWKEALAMAPENTVLPALITEVTGSGK
jgi:tetratricopeptide (TPR) repeat protein